MATKNKELKEILDQQAGRIPPQAVDIEEAVLGALMILDDVEYDYAAQLKPEVFYKEAHQKIYRAIETLMHNNKKVDLKR
jgi:replicative DNA helicase